METPKNIPTLRAYIMGYGFSLLITLVAFGLAYTHLLNDHTVFTHTFLYRALITLALVQFVVQAIFFLHLSRKAEARSNLITFTFMVFMVLFIGVGSVWIMNNLNTNMNPVQMAAYMHKEN